MDRRDRPRPPGKTRDPRPRRLADRIGARPRILFVGINPSLRSAEVGHPSGRNAAYPGFEDKLVWYRRLADYAAKARPAEPPGGEEPRD